jgi:hypothetical protein
MLQNGELRKTDTSSSGYATSVKFAYSPLFACHDSRPQAVPQPVLNWKRHRQLQHAAPNTPDISALAAKADVGNAQQSMNSVHSSFLKTPLLLTRPKRLRACSILMGSTAGRRIRRRRRDFSGLRPSMEIWTPSGELGGMLGRGRDGRTKITWRLPNGCESAPDALELLKHSEGREAGYATSRARTLWIHCGRYQWQTSKLTGSVPSAVTRKTPPPSPESPPHSWIRRWPYATPLHRQRRA